MHCSLCYWCLHEEDSKLNNENKKDDEKESRNPVMRNLIILLQSLLCILDILGEKEEGDD